MKKRFRVCIFEQISVTAVNVILSKTIYGQSHSGITVPYTMIGPFQGESHELTLVGREVMCDWGQHISRLH